MQGGVASAEFVVSIEEECLTAVRGTADSRTAERAVRGFLEHLRGAAPALPSPYGGIFNGYGRVYCDLG